VQSLHTITNFKDYRISKKFVAVINWIHSILPLMKEMRSNYIIYMSQHRIEYFPTMFQILL
jgi:fructose/tagatose bisphosphate aldolase